MKNNRKLKVAAVVAAVAMCVLMWCLVMSFHEKELQRIADRASDKAVEKMQQREEPELGQQEGSVTIYMNDGTVWGYFGKVIVNSDGMDGSQADVELHGAWLVGSTAEEYTQNGE